MEHFYLAIDGMDQKGSTFVEFLRFSDLKEAEKKLTDWLEKRCGLDCIPREALEKLRAEQGETLSHLTFGCPAVEKPADLEEYNGFYFFQEGGTISLFVTVVCDPLTAGRFQSITTNEYNLDKIDSEAADQLMEDLALLGRSFRETVDDAEAVERLRNLICTGGLPGDPFAFL